MRNILTFLCLLALLILMGLVGDGQLNLKQRGMLSFILLFVSVIGMLLIISRNKD